MKTRVRGAGLPLSAGIVVTLAIGMLAAAPMTRAAGPAPVDLGTAAPFAVLGASAVTNTGATTIRGNLGVSPGPFVTGFPPGTVVNGTIHAADSVGAQAQSALTTAYLVAAGLPVTAMHATLGGLTLAPGVYNAPSSMDLTGNLTLDGQNDPSSVWVFQAPTTLTTASTSSVQLINGASSCNVFWQVGSSATLGTGSTFVGTIMARASVTITTGAVVHGRALARAGAVTLDGNTITTTCLTSPFEAATPSPTPTPAPTPTATPSPTPTPTASPSPTPGPTTTPPPTGTVANGPGDNSTLPPFALPICLALGVLGLGAFVAQRRTIRPRPTRRPLG